MNNRKIEDVCDIHARIGWQGLTKAEYLDSGDYYLVTGVDFKEGLIDFENCHYVAQDRYEQDSHIQLAEDDVLVTKDGTIGKVAIVDKLDKPATLNSGVFVVRPRNRDTLIPQYLMLSLRSAAFSRFIESIKVGCTIAHLNQAKFLKYEIPVPNLTEQKCIIDTISKVESIIKSRKAQLQALDDLVKARFVEMFGDLFFSDTKHYTVPEIAYVYIGLVTTMTKHYVSKGTPLIFNSSVRENRFEFKERVYLDEEFATANAHRKHRLNDIITVHTGDVGTSAIIGPDLDGSLGFATIVSRINDTEFVKPSYLCDFFNSTLCKHQLKNMIRGDRNNLNLKEFNQIQLTIPSIEEQMNWELFRNQTDKSKVAVQKALDEAQLLFDSLMQEYFG